MALAIGTDPVPSLLSLSDEILVQIVSYLSLSAGNLLSLSRCNLRLQRLCHDRRVVNELNLGGDPRVTETELKRFLKKGLPVQKMSLSSLYWLNPTQVCNTLANVSTITSLNLAELRLSSSNISLIINSLPNLINLSLTFSTKTISKVVFNLESEAGKPEAAAWSRLESLSLALTPSPDDPSTLFTLTHLLATTTNLTSLKIYTSSLLEEVSVNSARFNVRSDFKRVRLEKLDSLVLVLHDSTLPYLLVRELLLCLVLPNCNRNEMSLYWVSLAPEFRDLNPNPLFPKHFHNVSRDKAVYNQALTFSGGFGASDDLKEISFVINSRIDDVSTVQHYVQDAKAVQVLEIQGQKLGENVAEDCPTRSAWLSAPSLNLSHLTKLSVPPCMLVDKQAACENNPSGPRLAHSKASQNTFSAKNLKQLAKTAPLLTYLDMTSCASNSKVIARACCQGGDVLLQAIANFSQLTTLRINGLGLGFTSSLFSCIFSGCSSLSELHCNSLFCDAQKLGRDLVSNLKLAKNLAILRIQQKQLSLWLEQLLVEVTSCQQMQQLVLIDPSKAKLASTGMPQRKLREAVENLPHLSFVHIGSPLFTTASLKKTLTDMRAIKKERRKHLVFSFHLPSKLLPIKWEQIAHIPGCFLDSLLALSPEKSTNNNHISPSTPTVGFSYKELFMDHAL